MLHHAGTGGQPMISTTFFRSNPVPAFENLALVVRPEPVHKKNQWNTRETSRHT